MCRGVHGAELDAILCRASTPLPPPHPRLTRSQFDDPNETPPTRDGLETMQNELFDAVRSLSDVVARADPDTKP